MYKIKLLVLAFSPAPVWPDHLDMARCKTSVELLSYGIGINLLKGRS